MRKRKKKKQIMVTVLLVACLMLVAAAIGIILGLKTRKQQESENKLQTASQSGEELSSQAETSSSSVLTEISSSKEVVIDLTETMSTSAASAESLEPEPEPEPQPEPQPEPEPEPQPDPVSVIGWNSDWTYASNSQIHESDVKLYRAQGENRKGIVVGINAGHGTSGGESVRTQCHPDGTAKVTGGSTAAGSTTAMAVAGGTTMLDGTPERKVTLSLAILVKEKLLEAGYDVLMIREEDDVRLDNIARTVFCNNNANCHIAIHYDSTENDKGLYFMSVPSNESYRSMQPVASIWQEDNRLGECVVQGARDQGVKVWSSGSLEMDLTQTSYSSVPSIDVEVGDRGSDYSEGVQSEIAAGIVRGIGYFFGQ